jgi:hypothetical protein
LWRSTSLVADPSANADVAIGPIAPRVDSQQAIVARLSEPINPFLEFTRLAQTGSRHFWLIFSDRQNRYRMARQVVAAMCHLAHEAEPNITIALIFWNNYAS